MSTVFEVLRTKYLSDIQSIEDSMSSGHAKSYDEYKEMCGLIRGLRYALRHVEDLSHSNEEYEDD